MGRVDFLQQLGELGYSLEELGDGRVAVDYSIELGSFAGRQIKLGLQTGDDFPVNPPAGGIHVCPRLLELHPGGDPPLGGINESPNFGPDWQYWSRPFPEWASTDRSARQYMAFVRQLFSKV